MIAGPRRRFPGPAGPYIPTYDPPPPKKSTTGGASDDSDMPQPHPGPSVPGPRRSVPVPPPPPPDPHAAYRARNQATGDALRAERAKQQAAGTFVPRNRRPAAPLPVPGPAVPPAPPAPNRPPNLPPREDLQARRQRMHEAQRLALRGLP
jgi:hypothetical protein